jgi:ABC-type Na+ transport system ATPase subunit NatA
MPADEEIAEKSVQANSSDDGLRVLDLTRSFGHFTTVENLTIGIKRGQVFALLGSNGAGNRQQYPRYVGTFSLRTYGKYLRREH